MPSGSGTAIGEGVAIVPPVDGETVSVEEFPDSFPVASPLEVFASDCVVEGLVPDIVAETLPDSVFDGSGLFGTSGFGTGMTGDGFVTDRGLAGVGGSLATWGGGGGVRVTWTVDRISPSGEESVTAPLE